MIPLFDRAGRRRRWPLMTLLLVAANVAVFAYEVSLPTQALTCLIHDYGAIPHYLALHVGQPSDPACPEYATPEPFVLTLISSMFIHAGWLHIAGNMLFLLIFGDNVEDRLGHLGFLLFYLLCGLAAMLAQTLADPTSTLPVIGASGAIAGVLGAYLVLFPLAKVRTLLLVFLIDLPAWLMIGVWILLQALSGLAVFGAADDTTGGVAYFAHLGGFALGLVIALLYRLFAPAPPESKKPSSG
ncbi:MAG TPA: rhomboid family intramembrane serine protease [Ktedonobacterales bacterium]|nr:rhomboid family intramembrane serine protease [Ktedonobacterales bacterium]